MSFSSEFQDDKLKMIHKTHKIMSKEQFSFQRGWSQVQLGDIEKCREELMTALGISTRVAFHHRLKGNVEPRVTEAKAIEDVFAKYNIVDVWGS